MEVSESTANILEFQELEAGTEGLRVELYTELLATYLLQDELCNAKFLWKRIPQAHKQNPELLAVWNVFVKLWAKDRPGFYLAVRAFQWSPSIENIMLKLTESIHQKTLLLIGMAYTSIQPVDVSHSLGMTLEETEVVVRNQKWEVVDGMIEPIEPLPEVIPITSTEDQLGKLTGYVTYLEN